MIRLIKKVLVFIATGTMSLILAACYGVPIDEIYYKLVEIKNTENNPIKGLEVVVYQQDNKIATHYSDSTGHVELVIENNIATKVTISDIDGQENNGLYENAELDISQQPNYSVILNKIEK